MRPGRSRGRRDDNQGQQTGAKRQGVAVANKALHGGHLHGLMPGKSIIGRYCTPCFDPMHRLDQLRGFAIGYLHRTRDNLRSGLPEFRAFYVAPV